MIGIRREDKNRWERRTPLIPDHIRELKESHLIEFILQPSKIRAFPDREYIKAGAEVRDDLSPCATILAIKEIPVGFFEHGKTYIFYAHVIKGQAHNMPMLRRMLELKCQLIDYERVTDEKGRRLLFFGRYAGYAGIIDSLWALGERLRWEGVSNPFSEIKPTHRYKNLEELKRGVKKVARRITEEGLEPSLTPFVCGITGYGNVSKGVQEILDLLPIREVSPEGLTSLPKTPHIIYKVVFKEEDIVEPSSEGYSFDLQDYYDNPERYRAKFPKYVSYLTLLMNCIYWDDRYPRLVTKDYLKELYGGKSPPRLRVIGDISCDVEGAVECTIHPTNPDNPVFVYDPFTQATIDGYKGRGPVVMAIDNLPCEIPVEASTYFSGVLKPFIPAIAAADFSPPFEKCRLPEEIKRAVIVYNGELTPGYKYIERYL